MLKRVRLVVPILVVVGLVFTACNMPTAARAPVLSNDDIVNTAAARLAITQLAAPTQQAPAVQQMSLASPEPTATQCNPTATATTLANVRSGPGLGYDVIGNLPVGGTAPVAGRDSTGTWWYIQFVGGFGGYAWIAGSVVSTACVPATLPMVAAPPLPTAAPATPTEVVSKPPLLLAPWLLHALPSPTPTLIHLHIDPGLIQPVVPVVPIGP